MKDETPEFDTVYETLTEQARSSRVINRGFGSDGNEPPMDAINRVICHAADCMHWSDGNKCVADDIELTIRPGANRDSRTRVECTTYEPTIGGERMSDMTDML